MPYQDTQDNQDEQLPYVGGYQGNANWQQNVQYQAGQPQQLTQMQYPQPAPMQQNQQQGQQPQGNPFQTGMTADQVRQNVQNYFQSRNTTPAPTSVDYWTQKWGEFGNNDPNYYWQRLQQADEFGGGAGGGGGMGAYVPGQGVPGFGTALGGVWGGRANDLYGLLQQRAGQSLMIDRNDPVIRNLTDQYSANATRGMRNYLADVAERAGPNANIGAETRAAAEKVAQGTAGYGAQLMGQERDARRQEIAQAIAQALGLTTGQQGMSLQEALAQMQLAQQAYQYDQGQQYAYSPFGSGY